MASQVESVRRVILELGIPDQWLQSDEIAGYFEEMIACSSGTDAAEFKETLRASLHEAWVGHQEAMKLPVLGEAALEQPAVPSLPERPVEAPAPGPKKARVHVATPLEREIKDVLGKGCTICGASTAKLLCVCKTTRYCSVQCQRVDWSQRGHRSVCRKIRERAEAAARHEEVQREEAPRDEPLYGPAPRRTRTTCATGSARNTRRRARREAEPEPELMSARFGSRCPICLDGWDI
ncbi:dihydrokaempferol 4-reductase [Aureococcus anophagefferens]|nr:dihydrokaempferol 4-reductase [Aureococcus anophagefferens]